jgi:hypothetical protein
MTYHADYMRKHAERLGDVQAFIERLNFLSEERQLTPSIRFKVLQRMNFSDLLSRMADVMEAVEKAERQECGYTEDDVEELILRFCEEFIPRRMPRTKDS